ncbi:MAG: CPBP family intramembrane metalloprotease [Nitrososphaerales archaeon]|nr:CPBP family intramembrane metalloprotease [Nitrososphaerales archaeon]
MGETRIGSLPLRLIRLVHILLVLSLIGLMVLSFPLGLYMVLTASTHDAIKAIFILLWLIYFVLFIKAMLGPHLKLEKVPQSVLKGGLGSIFGNTLSTLAVTFSALILITMFILLLQESAGIPTGSLPEMDPVLMFVSDSTAPILEETVFRMGIIGMVATLLLAIKGVRFNLFKVLWHPARHLSWTRSDMRILYLIVFISGSLFGLAHIAFGAGWEIGKVTTSSMVGIILGFIYVNYGFPGAVLLHWSFNYFLGSFYYFEKVVGESFLPYFADFVIVMTGIWSMAFLFIYLLQSITRIRGRLEETRIYNAP